MSEMIKLQRVLLMVALIFMALCFLVSAFLPHHRAVAHGLVLGSAVSCLNVLHLAYKVRKIADAAAGQGDGKRAGLGLGFRLATSILALIPALEWPAYFSEIAVAASLVSSNFFLVFIGAIIAMRES
ncbi:ATP synthase subunit I [Paenibacillus sp. JX-17]|uniref:ATP synthase subunit I n=1 Tax=Paenibacillus lacisoli TaxID=3064525 RepID=A0ABT9CCY5_9BACL|nr:ATP synthase subunit I [Paenibacillus sp. JX-17]MDO7906519.1 ATP synthase subunit I [Paenibacillus sp. JX-17]